MTIGNIGNRLGIPGLFVLLAIAAYSTILTSFFLSDDFAQIGRVLEGDFSVTWGLEHGGFFRPLFIVSYIIDSTIWGTAPVGYHLTNALLHGLNSYLVFILTRRWTRNRSLEPSTTLRVSLFAGLIFLLLPSHTEAVSWISGRADLLATLFALTALVTFDSYKQAGRLRYLAYTLVLFVLALMAKESAVCLPLIILALEISFVMKRSKTGDLVGTAKLGALLGASVSLYLLVRYVYLGTFVGGYGASHLNFKLSLLWERLPKFAVRAVSPPLPDQLSSVLIKPFKSGAFILFAAVTILVVSALIIHRRRLLSLTVRKEQNAFLIVLLASFLFSLLPVLTLGISVFDTLGERFVYLPSVFSSIAIAYISVALVPNSKRWFVLVLCVSIFYSVGLYRSNQNWIRAAALSQSVFHDLTSLSTHDDILILDVPGSLRGVPVYRNGLEEALRSFQNNKRIGRVQVVAHLDLPAALAEIDVVRNSENVEIRLLSEKSEFSQVNDRLPCVEVAEKSKTLLRMKLNNCPTGQDRFFFQHGRMMPVSNGQ
ncbi:MAG: hypothetical protein H7Z16_10470 [Pyrinomonadaceae bacterium]|nr:hypothetical protein [Pyrinomonadaceae bacterium]